MQNDFLKEFYENDATRFWDPREGMVGRDLTIYPLLDDLSGAVLDYGAGSGSLLLNLALEKRFTRAIGVDLSEAALNTMGKMWKGMAEKSGTPENKVEFLVPTFDKLPEIEDQSLDVVMSLDTIEHVMNPYTVLDELHRVTKPNGLFIISVPNYGYIKYVIQLFMGRQPITGGNEPVEQWRAAGWDGWHLHTFTKQGLDALLKECGWRPIHWTGYGDKGERLGLGILRRKFPAMFSGCLTVISKRV